MCNLTSCVQLLTSCSSLRRVKCDEAKPACLNCANNGRTCAGYQGPQDQTASKEIDCRHLEPKHQQTPELELPVITAAKPWYWILRDLSPDEGIAFAFFKQHTARELRGCSELQLWERWAMQLSHHEPAVLHGIIAVGALHRLAVERTHSGSLDVENDKQVALRNYGRAISQIRRDIAGSQSKLDLRVVLLSSLLFFCFEMLRGEGTVAMQHLQAGLRILADHGRISRHTPAAASSPVCLSSCPSSALQELVAAFAILDFDNAMLSFRRVEPPLLLALDGIDNFSLVSGPYPLESISQARAWLNVLGNEVFRLLKELSILAERSATADGFDSSSPRFWCYVNTLSHSVDLGSSSDQINSRKRTLEDQLHKFDTALQSFMAEQKRRHDRTMMALELRTTLLEFHIVTCRSTHETACDAFDSRFRYAVDVAERFIHAAPSFADRRCLGRRVYSLEPGVVPTLCLIAAKCRTRSTRHPAIKMLKRSGLQEALWDSTAFGTFVERLATLEEETAVQLTGKPSREELRHSSDIPERARFVDINLVEMPSQPCKHMLLCARYAHELDGSIVFFEEELAT